MTDFIEIGKSVIDGGATIFLFGFLVVLAVPVLKKKYFGNGDDMSRENREMIKKLEGHAEVANKEMGEIRDILGRVETDIEWIKRSIK